MTVSFVRTRPVPKATEVFSTYWRFAFERQLIYFRRLSGHAPPWTADPVIEGHRFTNAYRASDRVSQYLINEVIPGGDGTPEDTFFRVMLFKFFNRISTWELLNRHLSTVHWGDYSHGDVDQILTKALECETRIYSAAYIMPSPNFGEGFKHRNHLRLLESMMADALPLRLSEAQSMEEAYRLLVAYPGLGPFLAFQYTIDLNYTDLMSFSEMDFVVPGPGASEGLSKCFETGAGYSNSDLIRMTAEMAPESFASLGITFPTLWGRPLQLIDYQNLYCEVGKYARAAHPEVLGDSHRTRIKQRFHATADRLTARFPMKWGLPREAVSADGVDIPYGV